MFDNRILISNPGKLYGRLHIEDLHRDDYVSSLRNRLLAEVFYLTGDIERYGTGFVRIREALVDYPGLAIAVEEMGEFFKVELRHSTEQVAEQVCRLLTALDRPKTRRELQNPLQLQHREHFRSAYLRPALDAALIAMTPPEKPRAADRQYVLTEKGRKKLLHRIRVDSQN
ncbi:hypothetical protein L9S41_13000 [Geoalkalibacter halelectricus]|uniref:Filamentation induced by cAMP protein Fic-like C-terminal domain-containing protein n=1 Tax=Geoalkalibacter halelectricus TaxID=2847045 RepID=A0ABY5ZJ08_9BACT|nr:hypothetical protein [Geoalkalibacter halelectricus]UWZ78593.1 hypothetical protein L9S41_13000 [Geoalkalibacter halelectricus]